MKKTSLALLLLCGLLPAGAKSLPVVPYPKSVQSIQGGDFELKEGYTIGVASKKLLPAAKLFVQDASELYELQGKMVKGEGDITLVLDSSMKGELYSLELNADGAVVKAGNYNSVVMGLTTLLQMIDGKTKMAPACMIKDKPKYGYRAHMVDVAREFTELETLKQIVDLCRWYKTRYFHLHLSDDQMFTFESKHYPQLTEGTLHYSQEQLKELVAYATQRGVVIIPEFDLPGHSSAMRAKMPELFGKGEWSVVDVVNPKCMKALKLITKEMMDIFYTSPYFHIGGDEAWFGAYEQLDHVKKFLADNKDKYDGVHDLQLKFVLDMHNFVKSQGKKTLIWESFHGTGSAKYEMPRDLIVMAWETYYNPPEQLIKNGYTIINAAWKPNYTTREGRWTPEYIYNWNPRRWENWATNPPGFPTPIQLEGEALGREDQIMGLQSCAWEMIDHEQMLTASPRIPAFSEQAWNDEAKSSFADYEQRAKIADEKIMTLIFPASEQSEGFKGPDPNICDHSQIFQFWHEGTVFYKPNNPTDKITYSTDLSFPTPESTPLTQPIEVKNDVVIKFAMYDAEGKLRAYKSNRYQHRPIDYKNEGIIPIRDRFTIVPEKGGLIRRQFYRGDAVKVSFTNGMPGTTLRYSLDGQLPTKDSPIYDKSLEMSDAFYDEHAAKDADGKPTTLVIIAGAYDEQGNAVGQLFRGFYTRVEK